MRSFFIVLVLVAGLILVFWFVREQGKSRLEEELVLKQRSQVELTRANLSSLEKIILHFCSQKGRLPENLEELRQSRLLLAPAIDAWGREIKLEILGENSFRLISAGADGQVGTEDDIILSR